MISALVAAFTIGSAFSDPCHEGITLEAFRMERPIPPDVQPPGVPDQDATWLEIARYLEDDLGLRLSSDVDRMLLVSGMIGIRYPDQKGFAIVDLENIREIHLAEEGQEHHALRAIDHEGDEGNALAVEATRQHILDMIELARESFVLPDLMDQLATVEFYLDFYGAVDVRVWRPAFMVGIALHSLQDSFPHTYRSPDTRSVFAVANYVDGLSSGFDERIDGPRHSDFLDTCTNPEVAPLRASAIQASAELLAAVRVYFETGDLTVVEQVLDDWLVHDPGCGYPDYCDTPWAELARRDETTAPLACSIGGRAPGPIGGVLLACLMVWIARRRNRVN